MKRKRRAGTVNKDTNVYDLITRFYKLTKCFEKKREKREKVAKKLGCEIYLFTFPKCKKDP